MNHLVQHLGDKMIVDIDAKTVRVYQDERLRERAAPKTVNEEVGVLCASWVNVARWPGRG